MSRITAGEIWTIHLDNEVRRVKVVGRAGKFGWWRCVDLATDIYVLAREDRLLEKQKEANAAAVFTTSNSPTTFDSRRASA
jgi:hypothetical protein